MKNYYSDDRTVEMKITLRKTTGCCQGCTDEKAFLKNPEHAVNINLWAFIV